MTGYNGWKNKETWLVNLWLGDTFDAMKEDGKQITADVIENIVQECIGYIDDKSVQNGFLSDMLNCALGEIDYREISELYCETKEA